jgi:polysaccharide pyruvyl transferase CsaB
MTSDPPPVANRARHVVVAGWSGTANLGDELLLRALLHLLERHGRQAVVVSRNPARTAAVHGVTAIGLADPMKMWSALRGADGLVLGPGGILQDETSAFSLPWHLARVAEARAAGVPVVGIGLGAGPLRRRSSPPLVRRALGSSNVRGVAVRDQASFDQLARCGVASSQLVCGADLALTLPPVTVPAGDHIAVCLRPHDPTGHALPLQQLPAGALSAQRVRSLAAGLDEVATRTGRPLRFVALDADRDAVFHELVASHMSAPVAHVVPGLDDVLDELGSACLVVAMRFHAGIGAVLAGRPAVLVGYAPKVTALAGQMGLAGHLVTDDDAGHARLGTAALAALGTESRNAAATAHERLAPLTEVHDEVLRRLWD